MELRRTAAHEITASIPRGALQFVRLAVQGPAPFLLESWDCPDQIYSVKCTADQSNWACHCAVNGVVQKSFTSTNFCKFEATDHKTVAETGCGWTFPPEPEQ